MAESRALFQGAHTGRGTFEDPFRLPERLSGPNATGCSFCPTARCHCVLFGRLLDEAIDDCAVRRVTEVAGRKELCAKSVLPPFVERMCHLLRLTQEDVFYDLGSGNGSVIFQVAFAVGCDVVGVEISADNVAHSRELWEKLRPKLEAASGRKMPKVTILQADLRQVIADPSFGATPNVAVWSSNLLLPREITHYMSERFRLLAPGCRVMVFDDLYPHSRSVARIRDPECFRLFSMEDHVWTSGTVEWTFQEGSFYINEKLQ